MTAQFRDTLLYNGRQYSLATEPLRPYLEAMDIEFQGTSTANYRGYLATWEINNDKLYLLKAIIPGYCSDIAEPTNLFPGQEKTFADWYTGCIRIPHGERLEYVHQGYGSLYEKDLFLRFLNGKLLGSSEIDNRPEFEERVARQKRYEK